MKTKIQLYHDIMERLELDPSIKHSNITIGVNEGIVTIGGSVENYNQKFRVERAIKSISGVKAIANEMEVVLPDIFKRSDTELAEAALNALKWDVDVPDDKIQLVVQKGRVILSGQVSYWYQKDKAERTVRSLIGVKSVTNEINIQPHVLSTDVTNSIMKELEKNADLVAKNIKVKVENDRVILNGEVRSLAEHDLVEHAALSVPGVSVLESHISVVS